MIEFLFNNATARPAGAALRSILWRIFSPRYHASVVLMLDPIVTRAARTRWAAVVEGEFHEDGNSVCVAAFGWLLVADVAPKRGRATVPTHTLTKNTGRNYALAGGLAVA